MALWSEISVANVILQSCCICIRSTSVKCKKRAFSADKTKKEGAEMIHADKQSEVPSAAVMHTRRSSSQKNCNDTYRIFFLLDW
jgi:hypothetical protein